MAHRPQPIPTGSEFKDKRARKQYNKEHKRQSDYNKRNVGTAREIAHKLKNDSDFYEEVSNESKINYKKHFSEKVFKEKLSEVYKFCNTK